MLITVPRWCKSREQYITYLKCLSNIKIGDKVEVLLGGDDGFVSGPYVAKSGWRLKEPWPLNTIILPIIGIGMSRPSGSGETRVESSVVGVDVDNKVKCYKHYKIFTSSVKEYSIENSSFGMNMYVNYGEDLVYSRIIKRVNK